MLTVMLMMMKGGGRMEGRNVYMRTTNSQWETSNINTFNTERNYWVREATGTMPVCFPLVIISRHWTNYQVRQTDNESVSTIFYA